MAAYCSGNDFAAVNVDFESARGHCKGKSALQEESFRKAIAYHRWMLKVRIAANVVSNSNS